MNKDKKKSSMGYDVRGKIVETPPYYLPSGRVNPRAKSNNAKEKPKHNGKKV